MDNLKISFVVIALNAEKTIDVVFDCLIKQTYPHDCIEVILVDSLSSDQTKNKMIEFKEKNNSFKRVVILDNPKKTLPCGWNIALKVSEGDAILRVDAHTEFSRDFIKLNVADINSGENICGGRVISLPANDSNWADTLNLAENSMFGGSFATFRHSDSSKYVDTVAFAIYRKEVFETVGCYNEILTRTEDNEMHYRMRKAGFKFLYDPRIVSYRRTRATLKQLLMQKYLNGYWIGRTLGIEPKCFSYYHFVPLLFIIAIIISCAFSLVGIHWILLALCSTYSIVNVLMTILSVIKKDNKIINLLSLPIMFFLLHIVYGVGTLIGIFTIYKNSK